MSQDLLDQDLFPYKELQFQSISKQAVDYCRKLMKKRIFLKIILIAYNRDKAIVLNSGKNSIEIF